MNPTDIDSLIPQEIVDLIDQNFQSGVKNVYTTKEWQLVDSKKITNEKLIDMYKTILNIRALEAKLKK